MTHDTYRSSPHFRPAGTFRIVGASLCAQVPVPYAKWFSRHALLRTAWLSVSALLAASAPARAQVVRGVVVDEGSGRGLPATVVVLFDSTGKRVGGVLTDDDGRYAIRFAVPGRFAVRAERIGYRAEAPTPVRLAVGQAVEVRLISRPIPVALAEMRVAGRTQCVTGASDGREISAVWDEGRKALYATDLTQQQELFSARVTRYERTTDVRTGRVTGYQTKEASAVTRNPFVSETAARLSANGYVRQGTSETTYYGPDAGVLLSDEFLRDHCFRLRDGGGKRSGLIGLAFEPVRGREKPEISGTLWIDRKSAELRDLEYVYLHLPNLPSSVKSEDFGGHIEFHRMPTGAWIVERWVIRMPLLVDRGGLVRSTTVIPGSPPIRADRIELVAIREEGGEVIETVARGTRRTLTSDVASVHGTVFDSTRMTPLANARVFLDGTQFSTVSDTAGGFTLERIPPGTYGVSVVHARFDSLGITPPSVTVTVRSTGDNVAQLSGPTVKTIAARDCGGVALRADDAILRGHVRDANAAPAIEAHVIARWTGLDPSDRLAPVKERHLETKTDSAGRYSICGLPERVRITVRAVLDNHRSEPMQLVPDAGELAVVDMVVRTMPTVVASADAAAPVAATSAARSSRKGAMADFERRRRRGNGAYLTREQIDRMHATRLTDMLRTLPGVSVEPNESGALVVELRRSKSFTFEPTPIAKNDSSASSPGQLASQLTVKKCPAAFMVDGLAIDNGGTVDMDVRPEMIEAVEVYSGGQVPIEFSTRNSECGVVMIWTRSFAGRADNPPGSDDHR